MRGLSLWAIATVDRALPYRLRRTIGYQPSSTNSNYSTGVYNAQMKRTYKVSVY